MPGDRNEAKLMKWGLVPSWSPDPSIGNRMINARAETLREKSSFRNLVLQCRCVIPADGFYEWRREGNRKVPVWIHLKDKQPFVFAGLWDCWRSPQDGGAQYFHDYHHRSNALVRRIHNRMPVIYDDAMVANGLNLLGTQRTLHTQEGWAVSRMNEES